MISVALQESTVKSTLFQVFSLSHFLRQCTQSQLLVYEHSITVYKQSITVHGEIHLFQGKEREKTSQSFANVLCLHRSLAGWNVK